MKYQFRLPTIQNSIFELHASIWSGKYTLLKDGIPVERSTEKGRPFLIPDNAGREVRAYPKRTSDFAPALEINGERFRVVRLLKWYQYAIGALPLGLLFIGGAMGGVVGVVGTMLSYEILRQDGSAAIKYLKLAGIVIGSFVLYIAIVTLTVVLFR
jgi:hypothetical protein